MDLEKLTRKRALIAALPGGAHGVEPLPEPDATALNERIMECCCHRGRLIASFVDALREPQSSFEDAEGWQKLSNWIPIGEAERAVYVAADLYGYFRLPARRVAELLDSGVWSHEVYVVGEHADWLVGFKHDTVFLQGKAAGGLDGDGRSP